MDVGVQMTRCKECGREITDPARLGRAGVKFCCAVCAAKAKHRRQHKARREEAPLAHAEYTGTETILRDFICRNCGKEVLVVDHRDKRTVYCQQPCERAYWRRVTKERCTGNRGLSGGMSIGSLIRREAEDLR